jgi:hypothetical protein
MIKNYDICISKVDLTSMRFSLDQMHSYICKPIAEFQFISTPIFGTF